MCVCVKGVFGGRGKERETVGVCSCLSSTHPLSTTQQGITKLLTGGSFPLKANLLVGYLSEVVHLPLTVPLEVGRCMCAHVCMCLHVLTRVCTCMNHGPSAFVHLYLHTRHTTQVVTTRIITSKGRVSSLAQALEETLKEGGLSSLYKGITAYVRTLLPLLCE